MSFGVNSYRDAWVRAVNNDITVSAEARSAAQAIGRTMGIGRIATSSWHRLNDFMNRRRADPDVLIGITELKDAGYLERHIGDEGRYAFGWLLTLPGRVL
ncbi:hypothetical protein [Paenarthrobacter sp. Y-19]|uniref:hypothetical protein n=1 Tax=Paenarthrobacter sp. Y-19 TaxID=3031125 RepID=UPI0023DC6889|nr:hypothetical protein [Paenarthrobacter sp. Y-19]